MYINILGSERKNVNPKHKNQLKKLNWNVFACEILSSERRINRFGFVEEVNLIAFETTSSDTCCGVYELGDFSFSDFWKSLSKELRIACFNHLCKPTKKFMIVYALEGSQWDALTEILPDCNFIPTCRWRNPGTRHMIQAWYRNPDEPKHRIKRKRGHS